MSSEVLTKRFQLRQESFLYNNFDHDHTERRVSFSIELRRKKRSEFSAKRRNHDEKEDIDLTRICGKDMFYSRILQIKSELSNPDVWIKKKSIQMFKEIIDIQSISKEIIKYAIDQGLVLELIRYLNIDISDEILYEVVSTVAIITFRDNEFVNYLFVHQCVPRLIELIDENKAEITEQILLALGNIAGDTKDHVRLLLNLNYHVILIQLLEKQKNEWKILENVI